MSFQQWSGSGVLAVILGLAFTSAGCSTDDKKGGETNTKDSQVKDGKKEEAKKEAEKKGHDHSEWWCQEHGIPEHLCSLCDDEVAAKLKKAGDWCKVHDRAKSQCFKCDPKKYAKFEEMYVTKYGKKPPRPPEEEFKK